MRKFSWDEYYNGFYDWSFSTQKSYSYGLVSYGSADEVFEIALEFAFYDVKFASRFVDRAMDAGVRFTPEQVLEMALHLEKPVLSRMATCASAAFSEEELAELYLSIDDEVFDRISKNLNIDIFSEDSPEAEELPEDVDDLEEDDDYEPQRTKRPHLGTLFALLLGLGSAGVAKKKGHNGKCNGDCANCPPHYGYRYGRWYYGHGHIRGCEFGGNKGDGCLPY